MLFEFDSGHPDVLVVIRQQIKGMSNTSTFIIYDWLHVLTLIGPSSGPPVESSHKNTVHIIGILLLFTNSRVEIVSN
jgi:hypothetical protein